MSFEIVYLDRMRQQQILSFEADGSSLHIVFKKVPGLVSARLRSRMFLSATKTPLRTSYVPKDGDKILLVPTKPVN